jgi:hypothetical protein
MGNAHTILVVKPENKESFGAPAIDGRIILKRILEL